MNVVATSDFHWEPPPEIPECDLLLIGGDVLPRRLDLLPFFAEWLERQLARHIVGVAGNHDFVAKQHEAEVRALPWHYLCNEAVEIDGMVVWGSPYSLPFMNWAFMAAEHELKEMYAAIPEETEIVLCHGPAAGLNDKVHGGYGVGSRALRERVQQLPILRLLVTGHIHEAYGETSLITGWDGAGVATGFRCVNASYLNAAYQAKNAPIEVTLCSSSALSGAEINCDCEDGDDA